MNWKLKAHILAFLSRFPGGRKAYHSLQTILGTNKPDSDEYLSRALEIVEMIREAGQEPCNGSFFEIGTGWWPFVPFLMYLVGASKVISYDVNPWLNHCYAMETFRALGNHLPFISNRLGLDLKSLQERYNVGSKGNDLGTLLQAFRVDYQCPGDARKTDLPDKSIDFVCSSNVLAHIPLDILRDIHRESWRILRPGGLAVHRIGPSDQFCIGDRSITSANFLRYSHRQWYWYGGSGLAYQNRLRCVQHCQLLKEAGFSIIIDRIRIDSNALEAIRTGKQPVHPDFASFTPEELSASYLWLVGRRPN
jgi:SAM-dependent methyltransferase